MNTGQQHDNIAMVAEQVTRVQQRATHSVSHSRHLPPITHSPPSPRTPKLTARPLYSLLRVLQPKRREKRLALSPINTASPISFCFPLTFSFSGFLLSTGFLAPFISPPSGIFLVRFFCLVAPCDYLPSPNVIPMRCTIFISRAHICPYLWLYMLLRKQCSALSPHPPAPIPPYPSSSLSIPHPPPLINALSILHLLACLTAITTGTHTSPLKEDKEE